MYCRNCGKPVHEKALACPGCGVPPLLENKFCLNCGAETRPNQAFCIQCGGPLPRGITGQKDKIAAGLLAIFLGSLGIHKFYLGYNKAGVIMLLTTLLGGIVTCGAASFVVSILAFIEGIIYLTKSDQDFMHTYVLGIKEWF
jgi:TM2 domain-containing membrane protein YozV/RNA polymerase subunit RPABC4/transcription elongation factor Spt4